MSDDDEEFELKKRHVETVGACLGCLAVATTVGVVLLIATAIAFYCYVQLINDAARAI